MECKYCGREWDREREFRLAGRRLNKQLLSPVFPCYNCNLDRLAQRIDDLNTEIEEVMEESGRGY